MPGDQRGDRQMAGDEPGPDHAGVRQGEADEDHDDDAQHPHDLRERDEPPSGVVGGRVRDHGQGRRQVGTGRETGEEDTHQKGDVVGREGDDDRPEGVAEDVEVVEAASAEDVGEPSADQGADSDADGDDRADRTGHPDTHVVGVAVDGQVDADADDECGVEVGRHAGEGRDLPQALLDGRFRLVRGRRGSGHDAAPSGERGSERRGTSLFSADVQRL
ncbi:hypothetical protein QFZ22_008810 [Streptomyces canus]|uniref:Uncharacterized protein n=1 Tax=Streptomyces canus TaxID=58343 RepID=A0AAW8FTX0_9ACTN|nr:hypothetical protein [Streptomyces canus]